MANPPFLLFEGTGRGVENGVLPSTSAFCHSYTAGQNQVHSTAQPQRGNRDIMEIIAK